MEPTWHGPGIPKRVGSGLCSQGERLQHLRNRESFRFSVKQAILTCVSVLSSPAELRFNLISVTSKLLDWGFTGWSIIWLTALCKLSPFPCVQSDHPRTMPCPVGRDGGLASLFLVGVSLLQGRPRRPAPGAARVWAFLGYVQGRRRPRACLWQGLAYSSVTVSFQGAKRRRMHPIPKPLLLQHSFLGQLASFWFLKCYPMLSRVKSQSPFVWGTKFTTKWLLW